MASLFNHFADSTKNALDGRDKFDVHASRAQIYCSLQYSHCPLWNEALWILRVKPIRSAAEPSVSSRSHWARTPRRLERCRASSRRRSAGKRGHKTRLLLMRADRPDDCCTTTNMSRIHGRIWDLNMAAVLRWEARSQLRKYSVGSTDLRRLSPSISPGYE